MKQSILATKVSRDIPEGEEAISAQLLIRAGYIGKNIAGVYSFLPLGFRSVKKIEQIVREEMNSIGGQEVFLSSLQNADTWKTTNRWDDDESDIWFKSQINSGGDIGFGWTHEEPITELMKHHINSYRDLPLYLYQFQTKFRNEKRAKSGILRTREFVMKDLYSFSVDEESHSKFFDNCAKAYERIFERVGIGEHTFRTFASGGAFSEFSDEFQTITPVGEDVIYLDRKKGIALNKEIYNEDVIKKLGLDKDSLEELSTSEVGNIFTLGTRFSEQLGLLYTDEDGTQKPVFMGSYGIGIGRLLGIIAEIHGKKDYLILPTNVAPYTLHLISIGKVSSEADKVYEKLQQDNVEVLYDDRDMQPGEKFAESDLIGIPHRLIVSERSLEKGGVEYINRLTEETKIIPLDDISSISFT